MKRFLTFMLLAAAVLWTLPGCGCDDGRNVDLVFVNGSNSTIIAVLAEFEDQGSAVQNADSSPLKKGETFGFVSGIFPVTVMVYDKSSENFGQSELGSVTIREAPPEGERWYVTAKASETGLMFTVDTKWLEGI